MISYWQFVILYLVIDWQYLYIGLFVIMKIFRIKKSFYIVFLLTLIGGFLHFYNLNWGAPFYFHPDERNIANAVSQLRFSTQMNPHFFAYGSLPIYTIYFTGIAVNYFSQWINQASPTSLQTVTFEQAIMISRIYSAILATLLIPLLFFLGKKLQNATVGLLSVFFATFCVGFIQFAHFGTFEMWLTFFGVLLFLSFLHVLEKKTRINILLSALLFGTLVAIKITSLALLPIPLILIPILVFRNTSKKLHALHALKEILFFLIIAALVYLFTNPYVVFDAKDFLSSMHYESGVAFGTLPVFYTENFLDTTPIIYQFLHIYPFLLNPLATLLFIPAGIYLFIIAVKQKNSQFLLLAAFFLILFLSQAVLFVKWTRYLVPTIPFIILINSLALTKLIKAGRHFARLLALEIALLCILTGVFAYAYFATAFVAIDPRLMAVVFAQQTIPLNAHILTEPADLGILPFQEAFPHIDTFNFYGLDTHPPAATVTQLRQKIALAQYIILPSQRILQSRIQNPKQFPKGHAFYQSLLNGKLGFHKIYQTPCDIFCRIAYLGDPVYWWEQTVSVFDHPTVFIFKKNN